MHGGDESCFPGLRRRLERDFLPRHLKEDRTDAEPASLKRLQDPLHNKRLAMDHESFCMWHKEFVHREYLDQYDNCIYDSRTSFVSFPKMSEFLFKTQRQKLPAQFLV